ncbi:Serine/threonine-protein kinase PK-1 [termite gut metagenome]|uniref:Serine/threonine-protein kinase PK-1 n=1 Tax=termite gut metagenome TaxID=433724 RepID=A0A5J4SZW2_9ZZZZ
MNCLYFFRFFCIFEVRYTKELIMKVRSIRLVVSHLLAMGLLLFVLIMGVMFWLNKYTRQKEVVIVPEIRGMTLAIAERRLHIEGLEYVIADSNYINRRLPGSVLECTPSAGQMVKKGRTIYLTINKERAPEYFVPDVADNSSLRQAEAKILAAGFKLTKHELIAGEKDWVYDVKYNGQSLARGGKAPMEAALTLVVGNGLTRNHGIINSMEEDGDTDDDYEDGTERHR